jgi:ABC-type transport system substrate-binding protein
MAFSFGWQRSWKSSSRHSPFLSAVAIAICLAGGCGRQAPQNTGTKAATGSLRIGAIRFNSQDPLYGFQQVSRSLIFEGLVGNSREGRPRPRLAENWSVSADGLDWTFKLRSDARFQDGTSLDAQAVKHSLDESLASLSDRSLQPGLQDIVGIDVVGPREIVIRLRHRSTFLLDDLSMPISKRGETGESIGTGAFVTTSGSSEQIVMSSFRNYYQGAPQIQQIVWNPYPTLRTAWAGMMRGEIDFLYEVGQDAVEFVQGESSVSTFDFLRQYVYGVIFNSRREHLANSMVRQALNFGVNRQLIVDQALRGQGVVAHTPVWPIHWAYDQSVPGYTYDPGRASAILDAIQESQIKIQSNAPYARSARLRFKCLLLENFSVWERMALLVQKQLFDIGVDMELEALPPREFNDRIAKGQFDAVFLEIIGGTSMSKPAIFWHSASSRNSFGYRDPDVDHALDAVREAPDDETYRASVAQLQRSMIANPPAIFLAWGKTFRAVSRRFQVPNEPGTDVFLTVNRWRTGSGDNEETKP